MTQPLPKKKHTSIFHGPSQAGCEAALSQPLPTPTPLATLWQKLGICPSSTRIESLGKKMGARGLCFLCFCHIIFSPILLAWFHSMIKFLLHPSSCLESDRLFRRTKIRLCRSLILSSHLRSRSVSDPSVTSKPSQIIKRQGPDQPTWPIVGRFKTETKTLWYAYHTEGRANRPLPPPPPPPPPQEEEEKKRRIRIDKNW